MDFGQIRLDNEKRTRLSMYQNTNYNFDRIDSKTLILDITDSATSTNLVNATEFSADMFEPFIIDKLSDVYLDSFLTHNSNLCDDSNNMAFSLKINELKINPNICSNDSTVRQQLYGSILIPNEHDTIDSIHSCVPHKGKKMNYVCSINPCKLSKLTGKLNDIQGRSPYSPTLSSSTTISDSRIRTLDIASLTAEIPKGSIITISGVLATVFKAITTIYHTKDSTEITFMILVDTSPQDLTLTKAFIFSTNNGSDAAGSTLHSGTLSTTANTLRISDYPRFIAEFVIIPRN